MANTKSSSMLKYLGLMGQSGGRTGSLVPYARTPDAEQRLYTEFLDAGRVGDPDIWTKYNTVMKRPTTFEQMLQLWEEMAGWDLVAAALVEIVDEATQTDANSPGTLWYQCNDQSFEEDLNDMLAMVDVESIIQSQVWHLAAYGNAFEKIEYEPNSGVLGLSFVHPMEIRRYWLERNRKCVGFRWQNHTPNKENVFVMPDNQTPVERVSMNNGQNLEELWYPWDFCFAGDTQVSLLDGREVSLEELHGEVGAGEFWVYSALPSGRIVPGRAHSLKRTREKARVVEVELDNGEKVKCTPDHKFMLRAGTYRQAADLATGDCLMPLYRAKESELFFDNDSKCWRHSRELIMISSAAPQHADFDAAPANHKVVAVREAGCEDVYDFEVDKHHNFALSAGVFVHNCHFRRMYRMRISEHGEPIFAEADGIYKKLRLAIDQMVVHRAQVQPDRYAINIDVQEQPPVEQMKTVQRWRQALRSKLAFGTVGQTNDFNTASDFISYYNALALDTIIYLAQPKGFKNVIDKLPGTADVPDVYDIELLTDLFYSIIGMPRAWFGSQRDTGSEAPSGKALLAQDIRFLRKIKSIRRPLTTTYQWLGYFHAILKGKNVEQLDIKAVMPPIGSLEEQMKLEMLEKQAQVMDILADVMDKYHLPQEAWVETIFKRYMHLPDEVVNVFITALPAQAEQQQEESKKADAPYSYRLVRQIAEKLEGSKENVRLMRELNEVLHGTSPGRRSVKRMKRHNILPEMTMRENELVISSYGRHPFELRRAAPENGQPIMEKNGAKTRVRYTMTRRQPAKKAPWSDGEKVTVTESNAADPTVGSNGGDSFAPYRKYMKPK